MKKIYMLILLALSMQTVASFQARPFVISEVNIGDIIVSDIQTSLLAIKIDMTTVQWTIPSLEPGVIAMIQCTPERTINIQSASDEQVAEFNNHFEQIAGFFAWYDDRFVQKVASLYRQSPRENYVIKALLASRLPTVEFNQTKHNSQTPTYTLKNLNELCFTPSNRLQETLDRDWFFLSTLGKDLTKNSNIIPRSQRWADESMSMPLPPSTGTSTPSNQPGHTPTNVSTIRANYLKNFEPIDQPRTVRHSVNGIRRAMEYFPADRIIIHHTAGRYQGTKQAGMEYMRSLQQYHGRRLWRWDIGYHFLIDGEGNVYEWRRGGMHVVGAHVAGHNRGSIGISIMSDGLYSREMLLSLIDTIIFLGREYNIDVWAIDTFKNADLSGTEESPALIAHKEIDPGKPLDPMIPMDMFRRIVNTVKNMGPITNKVYTNP